MGKTIVCLVGINFYSESPYMQFCSPALYYIKSTLMKYSPLNKEDVQILQFTNTMNAKIIAQNILNLNPEMIGFSVYIWNVDKIAEIAGIIKKSSPHIKIFAGGQHISGTPKRFLEDNPDIDIVVFKDPEFTTLDLVNLHLKHKKNKDFTAKLQHIGGIAYRSKSIKINPREDSDINKIPSPILNRDIFREMIPKKDNISIVYETTRGCPFSCSYCPGGNEYIKEFGIKRIKAELNKLMSNKRISQIYFADKNFLLNKKRAIAILDHIQKKNKDTLIHFELNPSQINLGIGLKMQKIKNASYEFGIQTLNDSAIEQLNRKSIYRNLHEKLNIIKKISKKTRIRFNVKYGLPGDNYEDFKKTINKLISLNPSHIRTSRLLLLPGSDFYEKAKKYGIFLDKNPNLVSHTNTFSKSDMHKAQKLAFYLTLFYSNQILQYAIKLISKIANPQNPDYVNTMIKYFDYLNRDKEITMGFDFEDLEESTPEMDKLKRYSWIISNIKRKKYKMALNSLLFFTKHISYQLFPY